MWEKLCSSVVRVLDFNQATLSGSIDIICVRHREILDPNAPTSSGDSGRGDSVDSGGRWVYRSTPFHVRFGKAKLLKSREKVVSIYVNGELTKLTMKLGAAGEAYFGDDDADDADVAGVDGDGGGSGRRRRRTKRDVTSDGKGEAGAEEGAARISKESFKAGGAALGDVNELEDIDEYEEYDEYEDEDDEEDDGEFGSVYNSGRRNKSSSDFMSDGALDATSNAGQRQFASGGSGSASAGMMDYGYYAYNSKPKSVCCGSLSASEDSCNMEIKKSLSVSAGRPSSNVTLQAQLDKRGAGKRTAGSVGSVGTIGSIDSIATGDVSSRVVNSGNPSSESWAWDWGDVPRRMPSESDQDDKILQFSLCGHLLSCQDEQLNAELFKANLVDWQRLDADPSLWYHPSLVARFDKRPPYYQAKIALPLLASWIVFNRPLSVGAIERLLNMSLQTHMAPGTLTGGSGGAYENGHGIGYKSRHKAQSDFGIASSSGGVGSTGRRQQVKGTGHHRRGFGLRVSVRPTSQQLASLGLKLGANRITFTVTSALQGTKSVNATLYLYPSDAKIVISDVDGTITRSDALGHIMPILGRDWSHVGVAQLFTKIRANGYHVVYLTARAIGQADYTREYLFGLTQDDKQKLPQGPLLLSPDRLLPSFKREVITRSAYMFKIPALRDIRNLFPPDHNPFYAGFGNNESDHRAYVSVGMPESRVFIINSSGIIRHVNSAYAKTYESMSEIAEHMFPPINTSSTNACTADDESYNSFQYWNFPLNLDVAPSPDGKV